MRVCVVFKDGTEMASTWPDATIHQESVKTGRPDRVENVTVKYSHTNKRGVAVFKEIVEPEAPSRETLS